MLTALRMLAATSLAALIALGCGAEDTGASSSSPPAAAARPPPAASPEVGSSTLDACALPRPCSWPVSSGKPDEADAIRCVVAELSDGHPLSVDTLLVADGPASGCEVHQELHFFSAKGTAYSVWRKRCGANEERVVRRCTMLTREAYATCLTSFDASRGKPEGITCSTPLDWMSGCTDVADLTCP
jgi:hypothetical protein